MAGLRWFAFHGRLLAPVAQQLAGLQLAGLQLARLQVGMVLAESFVLAEQGHHFVGLYTV